MTASEEILKIEAALEKSPRDTRMLHRLADLQLNQGRETDAAKTLVRSARVHLDERNLEAESIGKQRKRLAATALLLHALRLDAGLDEAHVLLTRTYLEMGMKTEALEHLQIVSGSEEFKTELDEIRALLERT